MSKSLTVAERRHLELVHQLPCVTCRMIFGTYRPAVEAHHIEFVRGEHSTFATVPLCLDCHHEMHELRRRGFYRRHKLDDVKLLARTIELIEAGLVRF